MAKSQKPREIIARLASLAASGRLNHADASQFIQALLQTHADKAECTDYLHRVFRPLAEKSDDKALWTNLTLLAIYLGEAAITRRAAEHCGNTGLQHYLAWGLGDFQPAATDPLGGRSPLSSSPGGQQNGVTIGILDYKSPDPQPPNNNIDAIIHSVALMRHLARYYAAHWSTGDPRLATAMQFLQRTWPEGERQPTAPPVNLRVLDRDSAWAGTNPTETTYLPLYGWFANRPFDVLPVFPLPPRIQPLFLSLHLSNPQQLLTPDTIAWLKTCEPIGCRDKTTSDWLASAGVQTFFAGCLTTTLQLAEGSISPPLTPRAAHYRVDLKTDAAEPTEFEYTLSHRPWHGDRLSNQPFAASVLDAIDLLLAYQQAQSVQTSQLHCYLACRALGTEVTYRPTDPTDPELGGLRDLSQTELHRMQTTLSELTAQILAKIFAGAEPAEVRATWRELTAPLVAATAAEHPTFTPLFVRQPPPPKDQATKDQATKDQATKDMASNVVQVVMAFDTNLVRYVPNVVRSIKAHSAAAVAYHFLIDGVSTADQASLHQACPDIDCTWYDMADHFNTNKLHYKTIKWITRSTMSRLFLPELLPQIEKVVYLDVDTIVLGDIAELAATELGDAPLAACGGAPLWPIMLRKYPKQPPSKVSELLLASGLLAYPAATHFNAGVLVLSLETLRRDNFTAQALQVNLKYTINLHDQHLLNLYARGDYVRLPGKWNLHPKHIVCPKTEAPLSTCHWNKGAIGILHWKGGGGGKPWRERALCHHIWQYFSPSCP